MTSRKELIKKIEDAAKAAGIEWEYARPGGNHTIYKLGGVMIPVGNHRQFDEHYARTVYKECEVKLGKDWWK